VKISLISSHTEDIIREVFSENFTFLTTTPPSTYPGGQHNKGWVGIKKEGIPKPKDPMPLPSRSELCPKYILSFEEEQY